MVNKACTTLQKLDREEIKLLSSYQNSGKKDTYPARRGALDHVWLRRSTATYASTCTQTSTAPVEFLEKGSHIRVSDEWVGYERNMSPGEPSLTLVPDVRSPDIGVVR